MERLFNLNDLDSLAIGAGILGTGGGGNPYYGKLLASRILPAHPPVPVISLDQVPDDAVVTAVGGMGAPTVGVEMLSRGDDTYRALRALEAFTGKKFTHIVIGEIGGANAISPLIAASQAELPVIDADSMGRAFPELQMDTFMIAGIPPTPAAISNYRGHETIFTEIDDPGTVERYARVVAVQMGGGAGLAMPVMTGTQVKEAAIPGTMSLAIAIGNAVLAARAGRGDPVAAALSVTGGRRLFTGKIVDVQRRTSGGFARGVLHLQGFKSDSGRSITIDFQNENLIARTEDGTPLAVVPDLICLVDEDSGEPLTTEILRYGLRAAVLGIPAPVQLKTDAALAVVGPAAFGYPDVPYTPLPGTYGEASS